MEEFDIRNQLMLASQEPITDLDNPERAERIMEHKLWLQEIRKERPLASTPYKVGVYIRYFNQTRYENYLVYHKKGFEDAIAMCPKWTLVDFYIDEGSTAPSMAKAPEWCRLIDDCLSGKVDLIITQKVSNVSRKDRELTLLSRLLATQPHPIGIYFVSEDIFTTASYYRSDMRDTDFLPQGWQQLPEPDQPERMLLND